MKVRVAHTPDADDAFMFYAMIEGKIPVEFEVEHIIEDIETLNKAAFKHEIDVTALSLHAYAYLYKKYRILSAGASVGNGYGPIVVSNKNLDSLDGLRVAIPGKFTSANLYLKLAAENYTEVEMRFDRIIEAVKSGKVDAGLLIHEGQITYQKHNLVKVLDLWEWWHSETSLPMPLGVNVVSRALSESMQKRILNAIRRSIEYAIQNPDDAALYAMRYARGMDFETTKRFAEMYVNDYTLIMPESVIKSIETLFTMAEKKGLLEKPPIDILF